jgi:FkbM family methyltransferase
MGLEEGQTIADIGAGSGYFSWYFSKAVGPKGKVIAVDVDPHALEFLAERMKKQPPANSNIEVLHSSFDDTRLEPASVDWGFLCEAHFFVEGDPQSVACIQSLRRALKPGGKVAVIEVKDDPRRGKVSLERLEATFLKCGFKVDSVQDMYDREYFVIFK